MNARIFIVLFSLLGIVACEAPLNLEGVERENARQITRFDLFQAATHHGDRVVVVSSTGTAIVSDDNGKTWQRHNLEGRPSLIDVSACNSGDVFALDSQKRVWELGDDALSWTSTPIETGEDTLSIHCAPGDRLWVGASFGTLYWRDLDATSWQEFSLYDDLQFTNVRFVDEQNGFAVGEFGTVMVTTDGGENWEQRTPVPNDFYPMGSDFADTRRGWVGGLDGVIWGTEDGGVTWQRHQTVTSAPIYAIEANDRGVIAVGESAKLVEFRDGQWQYIEGAPEVLTFLRGLETLADGSLLVAGGGGTLALIPAKGSGNTRTARSN